MNKSTRICNTCAQEKDYPSQFITVYTTQTISPQCRECRNKKKAVQKRKRVGKTDCGKGWKDTMRGVKNKWYKGTTKENE